METIDTTRRKRLEMLIESYGSIAALNLAIGADRTDATLSQIRTQAPHSRTRKPRVMGDDKARDIESKLNLPPGWMDTPVAPSEPHENERIAHAVRVMEHMTPYQLVQTVRLIDTLADTPPPNTNPHND